MDRVRPSSRQSSSGHRAERGRKCRHSWNWKVAGVAKPNASSARSKALLLKIARQSRQPLPVDRTDSHEMAKTESSSIPHAREGRVVVVAEAVRPSILAPPPLQLTLGGDMRAALRAYSDQSFATRVFLRGRNLLCPMSTIALEVPVSGR